MLLTPQPQVSNGAPDGPIPKRIGLLRWVICALLFFATVINYVDRFAISFLAKPLQDQFRWSDTDYGWVLFTFQPAHATWNLAWGGIMDRVGIRPGYTLAGVLWVFAARGHG